MFTGIITALGIVRSIKATPHARRFVISSPYDADTIAIGASIAHDGCCLTIVDKKQEVNECLHSVDVSPHTLANTTLGNWDTGRIVNLERALKVGDELGGHMVSGHIDGVAVIQNIITEGESIHYTMHAPEAFMPYIAAKGSVTLDGVSLTVTWVNHDDTFSGVQPCAGTKGNYFGLTLIPHTLNVTTWGNKQTGNILNLEIDTIARYVKRILDSK